ncbi:type I DNA topoisomerase [Butyricicoccus sp.]|uniref:type I DNA topoisomerase n=1 Tax=Butyricicoccus sp. TaxID=2049021 RepID=UPI003F183E6A
MSKLVIVESPAKAKTIGKYLGVDYVVKASMGHLRDLPKKKMSVDIEHDFKPEYVPIEGKEKLINELRDAVEESDFVYLATDPDREGEAISWHLKELLHLGDSYTKRVTFNEITKHAVQEGIAHPRDIDLDLVDAQQARRILDRIVGYELSPFLWRKVKRGLSAGRVQSVATRMVVDREKEIRAFIPEEYWSLEAELAVQDGVFTANFYGDTSGKIELKTEEQTNAIVEAVTGKPFIVGKVKRGKKRKNPAPPFITSTLQQEASRKLSFVPRRTMAIAQQLYEGIEIGEQGLTGLITYMRTDSLRLSDEATAAAKDYIIDRYGPEYYPAKKRTFRTKNGAQDAHEAIRPTNVNLVPEEIQPFLTPEQYKLYKLIWSRFVACQMAEAILDTVSADILSEGYVFRASGYKVAFPGFTAVYEESTDDAKQETTAGKPLPNFDEGDALTCRKLTPAQHFTQPPARYTEASLIKAMEEKGIGRPSTYAPTISTILERDYVAKEGRSLRPTPLGEGVTELLVDKFQSISDLEFTAHMEEELDEVEQGKIGYVEVLRKFYGGFEAALQQAEKDLEGQRIKIKDEVTDEICEVCGKPMVIKSGRFGKFLACSGYPDCKNTKNIAIKTGVNCPKCGGNVVELKSKRGFPFLGCDNYPECTFMTWDKVTKKECPDCGSTLFRHYDRETGEAHFMCYKEGCGYKEFISKRTPRKTKAQKEAEAAAAAAENGETVENAAEDKPKKTAKKTTKSTAKKTTAKKTAAKKTTTKKTTKKAADGETKKRTTRKKTAVTEENADA